MLEVNHLRFSYGKNPVLRDIHFRAMPGEMVCILGPNGTGKSTLFKCMLGLLRGWDGEITLDGEDIRQMKPGERAKKMAYIPQAANPAFAYSVLDMVTMGTTAGLHGFRVPGKKERTDDCRIRLGEIRYRTSAGTGVHQPFRRRTAAGTHCPGAGAGQQHIDYGRTDIQLGLRKSGAGGTAASKIDGRRIFHRSVHAQSGAGVSLCGPSGGSARRIRDC